MAYDIIIGRNAKDREQYGSDGTIYLGKTFVKMGRNTSLSNRLLLDVIRSHVIFVCGKRGGGKCLPGDTLVTLEDGSRVMIKDLDNINKKVASLGIDLKMGGFEKSDFFRREVSELLKIRLRSGREAELTPEHPLLTIDGWIPANKIGLGTRIATPRRAPVGNEKMRDCEIKLLAYLIAEGHTKKTILFSNLDDAIVDDFSQSLLEYDSDAYLMKMGRGCYKLSSKRSRKVVDYAINREKDGRFGKGSSIKHEKTRVRTLLENHGLYGFLAREKKIPDKMFSLDKPCLATFLSRLFSCDGSIYRHSKGSNIWDVSYASSSEKLIRGVQSLLLKFEILSVLRKKNVRYNGSIRRSFELVIKGENALRFMREVGFFGDKSKRQETALREMAELSRNTNIDVIPSEVWKQANITSWSEIGLALGYKTPKSFRSSINCSPSRQKLLQVAAAINDEPLRLVAQSDIFWDEIMMMEKIEGSFEVYDIRVPETNNFIANDVIVHNSYTMGVIAEGVADLPPEVKNNISIIMLDTMGVYWTMKYPNKKDELLLKEWGLEPKPLDVIIYTPKGYFKEYRDKGIPTDHPFSIRPSELDGKDWCMTFKVDSNEPIGVLIQKVVNELREVKTVYDLDEIVDGLKNSNAEKHTINAAVNLFDNARTWGLFDKEGTSINELAQGGQVTILDVSCYATMPGGWEIKALVIGLVAQKLFIQRMVSRKNEEYQQVHKSVYYFSEEEVQKMDFPMVWLVIDEAHEFLPREGKTLATDPLVTIMREGRQPGISVIFATQQPGKIHTDVMTQSDTIISHRITSKLDTDALGALMQSYLRSGLDKYLDDLPRVKGAAIVLDDSNEKMFPMRVRPRFTWHGGEAPSAIQKKDKIFE
ncbi:hypothetical protein JW711_02290 [Candidatus Woesearchaeota archaeon]|nr:hypothetical protein [Candidatus Woesearchaeota archaeon]